MQELQERLRLLERRDWWLWSAAIAVMLLLALALLALSLPAVLGEEHPFFQSRLEQATLGLLALVLVFSTHTLYQQILIKRLRRQLAAQIALGFSLQSQAQEFQRLAMLDPLTGLYNRQFLEQYLGTELARAQRHGYRVNVVRLDLSELGQIHEQHGPRAVQLVLKAFADRLKNSIRSSDLAVRLDGDQFLVVLPESSPERVPHMLARLGGLEVDYDGLTIPVNFAAGWSAYEPSETPKQLLDRVHQEVVSDKSTGRGQEAIRQAQAEIHQMQNIEALGQLARKVAHDFNNLLSLVKGYSELALDRLGVSDPLREYIEQIHVANERANSLTRQLLAFSGQHALAPQLLDLNALIVQREAMLRRLIGEQIELITRPEKDLGLLKSDPGQIEQILLNLALNARNAMPQGGKFTLETGNVELDETFAHWHPGARPGSYVMLAVRDTGAGMDPETMSHIFEPFSISTGKRKATGLGLAAVYGIVKQSGGYIGADSAPGQGTTFTLYFPRASKAAEAAGKTAEQANPASRVQSR